MLKLCQRDQPVSRFIRIPRISVPLQTLIVLKDSRRKCPIYRTSLQIDIGQIDSQADANNRANETRPQMPKDYANALSTMSCSISSVGGLEHQSGAPFLVPKPERVICAAWIHAGHDITPNIPLQSNAVTLTAGPAKCLSRQLLLQYRADNSFTKSCSAGYTGSVCSLDRTPGKIQFDCQTRRRSSLATNDIMRTGKQC